MEALVGGKNPYSSTKNGENFYARKQMYINPDNIQFRETKLIQDTLTKGGYVVQYFGEQLPSFTANGTTGSSGIEGINILRDIYRHEQIQYRILLAERQRGLAEAALKTAEEAELFLNQKRDSADGVWSNIADLVTGGAYSETYAGIKSAIEIITEPFQDRPDLEKSSFKAAPTLGALATNIDIYFQGQFYKGFFTNFSVTESTGKLGLFDYSFDFKITKITGKRLNFMPWHRNPLSEDGETEMSQRNTVSKGTDGAYNLSFPLRDSNSNFTGERVVNDLFNDRGVPGIDSSRFRDNDIQDSLENLVPINRRGFINGGNS
jgi:hypothetical protein